MIPSTVEDHENDSELLNLLDRLDEDSSHFFRDALSLFEQRNQIHNLDLLAFWLSNRQNLVKSNHKAELDALQSENNRLQRIVAKNSKHIHKLHDEVTHLETELATMHSSNRQRAVESNQLRKKLEFTRNVTEVAENECDFLHKTVTELEAKVKIQSMEIEKQQSISSSKESIGSSISTEDWISLNLKPEFCSPLHIAILENSDPTPLIRNHPDLIYTLLETLMWTPFHVAVYKGKFAAQTTQHLIS